jgi:hypothetical protein
MERKKVAVVIEEDTSVLRWRKIGGSLRLANGKIIKPNQVFLAKESEIPKAFRDTVICLSEAEVIERAAVKTAELTKKLKAPEGVFKVVGSKAKGYSVLKEGEDKPINEKPFETKKEAEDLLAVLEA